MGERFICAMLLAASLALARSNDPSALFQKAKEAMLPRHGGSNAAIPLVTKAIGLWEKSSSNDPEYAEALDFLALLLLDKAHREVANAGTTSEDAAVAVWRTQAASLTRRALEICESHLAMQPQDQALALELEADMLGRASADGAPLWKRAAAIRATAVSEIHATESSGQNEIASVAASDSKDSPPPQRPGDGVTTPSVIFKREPEYSEAARLSRLSGTVLLSLVIDQKGVPRDLKLVQGLGYGLDEQAARAVTTWRFTPATKNGRAVGIQARLEVNFRLL